MLNLGETQRTLCKLCSVSLSEYVSKACQPWYAKCWCTTDVGQSACLRSEDLSKSCFCILHLAQQLYDPGSLPGFANQCTLGKTYMIANATRHAAQALHTDVVSCIDSGITLRSGLCRIDVCNWNKSVSCICLHSFAQKAAGTKVWHDHICTTHWAYIHYPLMHGKFWKHLPDIRSTSE